VNNIKQETYTDFLPIFNLYRAAIPSRFENRKKLRFSDVEVMLAAYRNLNFKQNEKV